MGLGLKRDSEGDSEGRGDRESASASLVSVRPLCNVLRAYVKLVRLLCVTHERTHLCQDSVSSSVCDDVLSRAQTSDTVALRSNVNPDETSKPS